MLISKTPISHRKYRIVKEGHHIFQNTGVIEDGIVINGDAGRKMVVYLDGTVCKAKP